MVQKTSSKRRKITYICMYVRYSTLLYENWESFLMRSLNVACPQFFSWSGFFLRSRCYFFFFSQLHKHWIRFSVILLWCLVKINFNPKKIYHIVFYKSVNNLLFYDLKINKVKLDFHQCGFSCVHRTIFLGKN